MSTDRWTPRLLRADTVVRDELDVDVVQAAEHPRGLVREAARADGAVVLMTPR